MPVGALATSTNVPRGPSVLSSYKRTITTLDKDSDELNEVEWPASQPVARPLVATVPSTKPPPMHSKGSTASAARSNAHWGSRAGSAPPVKRTYPWDHAEETASAEKRTKTTAYHQLQTTPGINKAEAGPSRPGSASLAKKSTANIRQKVALSTEQQEVLRMVVDEGKSVFFTGSAGTGKSVLLREIIASLRVKHRKRGPEAVSVTASTGMAACNIGGSTIHSFAGIGLGVDPVDTLVARIKNPKNRKAAERWRRTLVLVIDEVSMVDGGLFDKLDAIGRKVRKKEDQSFGGLQLVVTGDFFQLPPVTKGASAKYAFEASGWNEAIENTVNLTQVFRQKDTAFVDMLNELRFGQLSGKSIAKFNALRRAVSYDDGIEPTQLCALRNEVDRANNDRLVRIKTSVRDFYSEDRGEGIDDDARDKLLDNLLAPKKLSLKPGAQVMYLKNSPDLGLVNGTLGKVVRFAPNGHAGPEDMDLDDDENLGAGMNEWDAPVVRVKREKTPTASNGRSADDVPWVEWNLPGKPVRPVGREEFKIEANGQLRAARKQFPLILSWAVSIHKSQGQTLDRVKVDLTKIFEAGQAYVALSRATSMDRLEVTGFNPAKVTVNRKVLEFNKTLMCLS